MSLSLKLGSLAIRTLAKPVGNWLKHQAREHEPFRVRCVAFAQWMHRIDMRMRLGLLQDPAAIDRQVEREFAAEQVSKRRGELVPTVPTLEEVKREEEALKREKKSIESKVKGEERRREERRIRPLSEAKAIDSGATFISEAFLFVVAAGLIGFETWRGRRKAVASREAVEERLEVLEGLVKRGEEEKEGFKGEVERLRGEIEKMNGWLGRVEGVGREAKKTVVAAQQHKTRRKEEDKHHPPASKAVKHTTPHETKPSTSTSTSTTSQTTKKQPPSAHEDTHPSPSGTPKKKTTTEKDPNPDLDPKHSHEQQDRKPRHETATAKA